MTIQEMEDLAWEYGAVVVYGPMPTAAIVFANRPNEWPTRSTVSIMAWM